MNKEMTTTGTIQCLLRVLIGQCAHQPLWRQNEWRDVDQALREQDHFLATS